MCPLVKAMQADGDAFRTLVCVTGQHREMLDQVLHLFEVHPDYDLNIMQQGQDLYDITSRVLLGLRDILREVHPDLVFVHGDTSTSTAAALAAFYQQIPVVHVEAGLRTYDIYSPWPEEMNRQLTARLTTYHLAPTPLSRQHLIDEHIPADHILVTGNTVIDALHQVVRKIQETPALEATLSEGLRANGYDTTRLSKGQRLVLITGHRRENFGEGFLNICRAIRDLAKQFPDVDFVYPMHLNPHVREAVRTIFGDIHQPTQSTQTNLFFIEPLEYLPFVYLMNKSTLVLTDSGGIQEEAPGLGKPVLVMRETTERPEAVEAGTVKLVGTDYEAIVTNTTRLLTDEAFYQQMSQAVNPYGDGKACERIVDFFKSEQ